MEFDALNKRLDGILAALAKYQQQQSENLHQMEFEFHQMRKYCVELEEKNHLLNNANLGCPSVIDRANNEQGSKLEEKMKILQSTIALQDARYKEEINRLEEKYNVQVSMQQKTIEDLKFKMKHLSEQDARFPDHPAFHNNVKKSSNKQFKKVPASSVVSKWPDLDVQISKRNTESNQKEEPQRKKKKLYQQNDNDIGDII